MRQKKQTGLKKIEPPLPIYSIFITNGKERVFYGMIFILTPFTNMINNYMIFNIIK